MRSISAAIRNELEASQSGDFPVVFAEITEGGLSIPVKVTSDTQNYVLSGSTWVGWSFDLTLPSDEEDQSKARISIQNVDSYMVSQLMEIATPLRISLKIFMRSQFTTADPAVAIGSPDPVMNFRRTLYITNVQITDELIIGDVVGDDFSVEPWPYGRVTRARFPGHYR